MTTAEAIAKSRAIAAGSSCFLLASGGVFKICRRIGNRIVSLGTRTDASQALSLLRKVANH
jgi:hypothetical protein